MTYVHSPDGATTGAASNQPGTSRDLTTGEWVMLTDESSDEDRARCGWYPVTVNGTDQGDGWILGPISNDGPGSFSRTWVFDQATADAIADRQARQARGDRAGSIVAALDNRADFYDTQPAATTNAQALTYINTMKDDQAEVFRVLADLIQHFGLDA